MAAFYDRTRAFPGDGERVVPMSVAERLRTLSATRVLDLGCGTGRFTLPLAAAGLRVVGADRSPEMLSMLTSKLGGSRAAIVRCDAEALPFRRAFDAVVFSHFLHLVPSIETLAHELRRVLTPDAHVIVVDTGSGPRPTELRLLTIVMPLLVGEWTAWPIGTDSKDRQLLRTLLAHLGGVETGVVPVGTFPQTTTLREVLTQIRERTWSTFRAHPAGVVARAADVAERQLLAEGTDLDAREDAPVVVRLLVGRVRSA